MFNNELTPYILTAEEKTSLEKLISELRVFLLKIEEPDRINAFSKIFEGFCRDCGGKINGTRCWSCYDSGCDR